MGGSGRISRFSSLATTRSYRRLFWDGSIERAAAALRNAGFPRFHGIRSRCSLDDGGSTRRRSRVREMGVSVPAAVEFPPGEVGWRSRTGSRPYPGGSLARIASEEEASAAAKFWSRLFTIVNDVTDNAWCTTVFVSTQSRRITHWRDWAVVYGERHEFVVCARSCGGSDTGTRGDFITERMTTGGLCALQLRGYELHGNCADNVNDAQSGQAIACRAR